MRYNIIAESGIKPMKEILNKYVMPALKEYEKQGGYYASEMPWIENRTIEEINESYDYYAETVEKKIERKIQFLEEDVKLLGISFRKDIFCVTIETNCQMDKEKLNNLLQAVLKLARYQLWKNVKFAAKAYFPWKKDNPIPIEVEQENIIKDAEVLDVIIDEG